MVDHFGKEQVFRDLDAIVPGAEFATVIEARISQSKVLIAVIGKDWLNAKNEQGQRRLDAPNDLVRAEIREALNQKKWVIPVLVEGASIPNGPALPSDIVALAPNAKLRAAIVPPPADSTTQHTAEHAHHSRARMTWVTLTQAGFRHRHRHRTLPQLWRRLEDHRRSFDRLRTGIEGPPVIARMARGRPHRLPNARRRARSACARANA